MKIYVLVWLAMMAIVAIVQTAVALRKSKSNWAAILILLVAIAQEVAVVYAFLMILNIK
jgi:hypothetical protein